MFSTTLHEFDGAGGSDPESALILATDGNFYGTTKSGGSFGQGTVFHVDAAGAFATLHSLNGGGTDGDSPVAALFQASDGKLYGGAANGGIGGGKDSFPGGTLFRVDTAGSFGVIHDFIVGIAGNGPGSGPLGTMIDGHDGFLYGTTIGGSTVYRVNTAAQFSYAANVGDPSDGYAPETPLTEVDGVFYGTTPGHPLPSRGVFPHESPHVRRHRRRLRPRRRPAPGLGWEPLWGDEVRWEQLLRERSTGIPFRIPTRRSTISTAPTAPVPTAI